MGSTSGCLRDNVGGSSSFRFSEQLFTRRPINICEFVLAEAGASAYRVVAISVIRLRFASADRPADKSANGHRSSNSIPINS